MKVRATKLGWVLLAAMLGVCVEASAQEGGSAQVLAPEAFPDALPDGLSSPLKDYHVVEPGDTLFSISSAYFGSPYVWPIVWAYNEHVTNPHWIYPGDIVYLRAPLPGDPPAPGQEPRPYSQSGDGLSTALLGYITNKGIQSVGAVEYSPENKNLLVFPDTVYISIDSNEKDKVREGKVYAVLRYEGEILDEDDNVKGRRFRTVGAVRVVEPAEKGLHKAIIVQSWEEIYRGDILYPYERQLLRVAPSIATKTVVGRIADTLERRSLFGESFYVLIDKGSGDGVRAGNRFFVYTRFDGRSDLDEDDVSALPYERIAQLLVIHSEEDYSTALVVESKREMQIGWRVEMYEGF